MGKAFDLTPKEVPAVHTPFRHIVTPIPVPDSVQERILACTDLELLHRWTCQAVVAGSLDEALK